MYYLPWITENKRDREGATVLGAGFLAGTVNNIFVCQNWKRLK